jgi:lipoprotein signal peptidase
MPGQVEIAEPLPPSLPLSPSPADSRHRVGQRLPVFGVLAVIAVVDQGFKWWAWRNASGVRINDGGDILVPYAVGSLYSGPVTGALLDLVDSGLLIAAVLMLLRRRRSTLVLMSAAVAIGGWGSNLLDRLFTHYGTAPGSVRGVVDFIPLGLHYYNVADAFIVAGTAVFVLAVGAPLLRSSGLKRPAVNADVTPRTRRPARVRRAVVATQVVLTAVVGVGAANFGGVTEPVIAT